ncbi:MAG: hypothetical protein K0U84_20415 [Actinomycetia bacterium]|nr:hypothetical protein [Actinomycetes bacterium]
MSTPHLLVDSHNHTIGSPDERQHAAQQAIWEQLTHGLTEHPRQWRSLEEGAVFLGEKVDELWEAVRSHNSGLARAQAAQVGARALRFIADLYEPSGDPVTRCRVAAAESHHPSRLVGPRGRSNSSPHEAFGFLRREYDALWSAIRFDEPARPPAARVAAAAARFIAEFHTHPAALVAVADQ